MRDPSEFLTRRGIPWIVIGSRIAFALYFLYSLAAIFWPPLPSSTISFEWIVYLVVIYVIAEKFYAVFLRKAIDMSFAFPLLLAVYLINLASMLLGGQDELPMMNRIEHFASFILIAYVVSVFFSEYLPQRVWKKHPYYTALIILAIASLAGVVNELVELFFDVTLNTEHIGARFDTAIDLLMNTLGAGVLLLVRLMLHTSRQSSPKPVAAKI